MSTTKTVSILEPRRCFEGDMLDYGQSMHHHTKLLLTKASKSTEIHSRISSLPHNSPSPRTATISIPSVTRVPHANDHTLCKYFTRTSAPDPTAIEKAINELNKLSIKPSGSSKIASIKTPFDPALESKKKVLNRHGLRLTLDDRRPTLG